MNEKYRIVIDRTAGNGESPYKLVDGGGVAVEKVNDFLDSLAIRGLSEKTISSYAYDLLNFWDWVVTTGVNFEEMHKKTLLDYIQHQRQSSPAATTINHRITVVECLYQYCYERRMPSRSDVAAAPQIKGRYRLGWLRPFGVRYSTRVKESRRIIVPMTREQVIRYFSTVKTWRDMTITGFMLFCGLRRQEVLNIRMSDIGIAEGQVKVRGKGNKERIVPLPTDLISAMNKYIELERPKSDSEYLVLVLKGPHRGRPLTEWGMRELFRYHRKISGIQEAHPHRFRHTFGADMVRAGISLPALMKLMGHSYIKTTMRYVNISATDIRDEFQRVITKLNNGEILHEGKL